MSDPLRTNPFEKTASTVDDAERDAKIENLLLAGLDQYFAADYAQAIDIWTRALFLDRNHARARAYIERARSAMAEQQRESEELLHNGVAAFERGEIEAAKEMLNAAVQRGGAHDVALAFLTRIDRIHAATSAQPAQVATPSKLPFRPRPAAASGSGMRWASGVMVLLLGLIAAGAINSWDGLRVVMPASDTAVQDSVAPVRGVPEPLIVPRSSETALDRARALFESGRFYDALRAVDLVRPTDPLRGDADELKAAIQRELLAFQTMPGGSVPTIPTNPTNPTLPKNPTLPTLPTDPPIPTTP
jgi:tetratricopeptide (TPR) repeat protein